MKNQARVMCVGSFLMVALLVTGCAEIGFLGSKTQSFNGTDSMVLSAPSSDIFGDITAAGKSMGYEVSGLDKNNRTITISSATSFAATVAIGKINNSYLMIMVDEGGTTLNINVMVTGNFGSGGQKAAERLVNDFKTKLLDRLNK